MFLKRNGKEGIDPKREVSEIKKQMDFVLNSWKKLGRNLSRAEREGIARELPSVVDETFIDSGEVSTAMSALLVRDMRDGNLQNVTRKWIEILKNNERNQKQAEHGDRIHDEARRAAFAKQVEAERSSYTLTSPLGGGESGRKEPIRYDDPEGDWED